MMLPVQEPSSECGCLKSMRQRCFCHPVAGAVAWLFLSCVGLQAASSQPEGVSFLLSLKGGRQQFRLGEVIALRLTFSSSIPKRYSIDLANYDRSGRMNSEEFRVDPSEGWSDPLADYFNSGLFSFMGGGIRSVPELGVEPQTIDLDLNEWVRFDRPGHYRLSVTSSRIVEGRTQGSFGTHLKMTSNDVEFEIVPSDDAWAGQEVARAIAAVDFGDHEGASLGARTLRSLGTEEAATAMVQKFSGGENDFDGEYMFGLLGSPHRTFVVQQMEQALDRTDHPIRPLFLRTLAVLAYRLDHPEPLPPLPPIVLKADDPTWVRLRQEQKEREIAFRPYIARYLERLMSSLPKRRDRPFGEALITVLVEGSEAGVLDTPAFGGFLGRVQNEISSIFPQLPKSAQDSLLSFWWAQIRSPEMVPVLRRMYDATPGFPRGQYLQLINDLDPKQARGLVLQDMQRPQPILLYDEIHVFGNEPLPQVENVLAIRLDQAAQRQTPSLRTFAMLVERHATNRVLPQVKAVYEHLDGPVDCSVRAHLIAYFLRADFDYGKRALEEVQSVSPDAFRGCETSALGIALDREPSATVQQLAISRLWNADPRVAIAAAETLQRHGSAGSEKALWTRAREWHEQWLGRSEELNNPQYKTQSQLGASLLHAIAEGEAWLADRDKLTELRKLCVSNEQYDLIDRYDEQWKHGPELEIIFFNYAQVWPHVAQYELQSLEQLWRKLAQFPAGTKLTCTPQYGADEKAHAERVMEEVARFAEEHGLQLEVKSLD